MQLYETIVSYGHGSLAPNYLVIHETANPGATAYNHLLYWTNYPKYAVHYVTDWNGRLYHCVPDDKLCWHVGGGNSYCIGIELCHAENKDDFDSVWRTGIEAAAYILELHGWNVDENLICHNDARIMWGGTDHTDPIDFFESYGKTWQDFKDAVKEFMESEETEVVTNEDITSIAKACANYVWGYEKQGQSAINRLLGLPSSTALETLGYTNKAMNGNNDVYQLITNAADADKKLDVLVATVSALTQRVEDLESKIL